MDVLESIRYHALKDPNRIAFQSNSGSLTYGQLMEQSDKLAHYLQLTLGNNKSPLVVYGHKHPLMLVCFLACVKSGRAYCPVDVSVPFERVSSIIQEANPPLILATEDLSVENRTILGLEDIQKIIAQTEKSIDSACRVQEDDVFYIIFTSGSTGTPKGVQITADCLGHFIDWAITYIDPETRDHAPTFINQAPFSFDLSVMDLYPSLCLGGHLWALDKAVQNDMKSLLLSLRESNANVWVSTPSFADMCLSDKLFSQEILPSLELFLFCGETLTNSTVSKLHRNFPNATIVNTYGPTESTVAVTGVVITPELNAEQSPLPVGAPKQGTFIQIRDAKGNVLSDGERGEIVLIGDTVSVGYFHRPELTEKVFSKEVINGTWYRSYRTGDEGYLKNGMLYYCGRIDLQIKLHGYRIEIEDIENNILKLEDVKKAVAVPVIKENKVKSITSFVILSKPVDNAFKTSQELRSRLHDFVPDYMIPKKFIFVDSIPMTNNGKADRKALGGLVK